LEKPHDIVIRGAFRRLWQAYSEGEAEKASHRYEFSEVMYVCENTVKEDLHRKQC
jgi:hypothetical protein